MSTLGDRTFLDLSLTIWTASTHGPKAGGLAPHLEVLVFASEKGQRWAPIVRGSLHLYSPRDPRDLLEQAKALPGASTTS
jgi:hypothetical protein